LMLNAMAAPVPVGAPVAWVTREIAAVTDVRCRSASRWDW
jgi:hypothetical protein